MEKPLTVSFFYTPVVYLLHKYVQGTILCLCVGTYNIRPTCNFKPSHTRGKNGRVLIGPRQSSDTVGCHRVEFPATARFFAIFVLLYMHALCIRNSFFSFYIHSISLRFAVYIFFFFSYVLVRIRVQGFANVSLRRFYII